MEDTIWAYTIEPQYGRMMTKKQTQKIENKIKTNNIIKNCFQLIISKYRRDGVARKRCYDWDGWKWGKALRKDFCW